MGGCRASQSPRRSTSAGHSRRDAQPAVGYPSQLQFRIPDELQPGTYRLERYYSYGPSGKRTDLTLSTTFAVVAR